MLQVKINDPHQAVGGEQPDRKLATFSYRAVSPLFDTTPFSVHAKEAEGGGWDMWAANADGGLAMTAEATFSD